MSNARFVGDGSSKVLPEVERVLMFTDVHDFKR